MANTLRSCIVAEQGYTLISADASQIELRVLAIMSKDPNMIADLKTGDLHLATAIRMFGEGILEDEALKKKKRYDAKQGNFALVYGADAFKLSQMLECSVEEAEEFMAEHRAKYPVLYQYMDRVKADAKRDGFVVNLFKRIRPIPELNEGSWKVREKAERECVNTVIQGTAVDIVKLMMLYMRRILDTRVRLVLQVHDEMVWECPDELLEQSVLAHEELRLAFPDYPVEVKVGKVYGEMKAYNGQKQP